MTLYLIRHGETAWNVEGRMQGGRDSALTARGRAQAERLGVLAATHGLTPLPAFASPLRRAAETAALAGLSAVPMDDLAELGMGAWEGRLRADLTDAAGVTWKLAAPGGEGAAAFETRIARVLRALPRPAVVVTHGMVLIALRARLRGLDRAAWDALDDRQGVIYRVADGRETVLA